MKTADPCTTLPNLKPGTTSPSRSLTKDECLEYIKQVGSNIGKISKELFPELPKNLTLSELRGELDKIQPPKDDLNKILELKDLKLKEATVLLDPLTDKMTDSWLKSPTDNPLIIALDRPVDETPKHEQPETSPPDDRFARNQISNQ